MAPQVPVSLLKGASADFVDLLKQLLVVDPRQRISWDVCSNYPLFLSSRAAGPGAARFLARTAEV